VHYENMFYEFYQEFFFLPQLNYAVKAYAVWFMQCNMAQPKFKHNLCILTGYVNFKCGKYANQSEVSWRGKEQTHVVSWK
jgi:hypothetical protein